MLPEVTLRNVSMDDVDRVAWWLEDWELSSSWFGHYGCGDPVHRGYDPRHMIEATVWEWGRVFGDPNRLISSMYDENGQHIGECQVIMDGEGGAELSLLIGVKELWHRGYGTATVMMLLDKVFDEYGLSRAWVNVPEDNPPAMGLFEKLGFVREETRELCRRLDGTALNASILAMDVGFGRRRWQEAAPVLTVTGLPWSGSQELGAEVARLTGSRFVDAEINERLYRRLRCTAGEIESLGASYRSAWTRLLRRIAIPMEWSAAYDAGYYYFRPDTRLGDDELEDHITKKQYLQGLSGVIKGMMSGGGVVLHGHGSHLFARSAPTAVSVFVSASLEYRRRRLAAEHSLDSDEEQRWLRQADRNALSIHKNLLDADLLDMNRYDMTVDLDRMPIKAAAEMLAGALEAAARSVTPKESAEFSLSLSLQ